MILGNGNGTFLAPKTSTAYYFPLSVAAADLNHDGNLDVTIATWHLASLLGKGDGTFVLATESPSISASTHVNSGDVNGDDIPDVVVLSRFTDTAAVHLGNGDGTFAPPVTYATGAWPEWTVVRDFDGDTFADVAIGNGNSGTISVFLSNGDGTLKPKVDYPASGLWGVETGDFDNDGVLDLAYPSPSAKAIGVYFGNGDGTFGPPKQFNFDAFSQPTGLVVQDFNCDGIDDLAASATQIIVILSNGDGTFRKPLFQKNVKPIYLQASDLNNDGCGDLILDDYQQPGRFHIYLGLGNGTFGRSGSYKLGMPLDIADFNNDSKLDLVLFAGGLRIALGDGTGGFKFTTTAYMYSGWPGAAADFNGDGYVDYASTADNVAVLLNSGVWDVPAPAPTDVAISYSGALTNAVAPHANASADQSRLLGTAWCSWRRLGSTMCEDAVEDNIDHVLGLLSR